MGSQTPLPIDVFIVTVDISGACLCKAALTSHQHPSAAGRSSGSSHSKMLRTTQSLQVHVNTQPIKFSICVCGGNVAEEYKDAVTMRLLRWFFPFYINYFGFFLNILLIF